MKLKLDSFENYQNEGVEKSNKEKESKYSFNKKIYKYLIFGTIGVTAFTSYFKESYLQGKEYSNNSLDNLIIQEDNLEKKLYIKENTNEYTNSSRITLSEELAKINYDSLLNVGKYNKKK